MSTPGTSFPFSHTQHVFTLFNVVNPIGTPSIGTMTESIKSFVMGNERFRKIHFAEHEQALLESIKHGQRPKALFMGCSDSRVLPDAMMQVRAGDLFVSRNIGAFVAPYTRSPAHAGYDLLTQATTPTSNFYFVVSLPVQYDQCHPIRRDGAGRAGYHRLLAFVLRCLCCAVQP